MPLDGVRPDRDLARGREVVEGVLELDDLARLLLALIPPHFDVAPVPAYPPVYEDIAVVVDEALPAEQVAALIRQTGGKLLADRVMSRLMKDDWPRTLEELDDWKHRE